MSKRHSGGQPAIGGRGPVARLEFLCFVPRYASEGHMDHFFQTMKDLAINPFVTISGWVIGVISFVLAIVFYLKSSKERRPCYAVTSNNIIKQAQQLIPGLSVRYSGHGEELSNFTISKLAFWNAGRETIRKADLVKADPITVQAKEGCVLLGIEVLYASPSNDFGSQLHRDKKSAELTFDYIDRHEGIVLLIAHTGLSNDALTLTGKIKGGTDVIRLGPSSQRSRGDRMGMAAFSIAGTFVMAGPVFTMFRTAHYVSAVFFLGLATLYAIAAFHHLQPGVPKALAGIWHSNP
jgi:hypothetical protein